jgi:hypothetical protein
MRDALRRHQTPSDAIRRTLRRTQTHSDALRYNQTQSESSSEGLSEGFEPLHARTCESVASPSTLSFMKGMRAHAAAAGP